MIKLIRHTPFIRPLNFKFASAAAAAIDYYSLLGVQRGSTTKQIQEAFAKLTRTVNPDTNSALFNRITEAFVILSDGKARDAYDSLLRVRKFSYINDAPSTKPSTISFVADRKAEKHKEFAKQYNIDKFGRYKGGVPRRNTTWRGTSLGETGTLFSRAHTYDVDKFPEYTAVDMERAESFKNFHQNERIHRTAKRPWYKVEIDYQFFSIRRALDKLGGFKLFVVLFFLFPIFVSYGIGLKKRVAKSYYDEKKNKKKLEAEKKAAH